MDQILLLPCSFSKYGTTITEKTGSAPDDLMKFDSGFVDVCVLKFSWRTFIPCVQISHLECFDPVSGYITVQISYLECFALVLDYVTVHRSLYIEYFYSVFSYITVQRPLTLNALSFAEVMLLYTNLLS